MSLIAGQEVDDLFQLAGVAKNALEDCWEFVFSGSPRKASPAKPATSPHTVSELASPPPKARTESVTSDVDAGESESGAKKKKNRKKKRTKSVSSSGADAAKALHVQWGAVEQLLFERCYGHDAVPSDGLFPLGLGDLAERCCFTVDELFAQKQLREHLLLQAAEEQRKKALPQRQSARIRKGSFDLAADPVKDERERERERLKALFSPRAKSEYERMQLLGEFIDLPARPDHVDVHVELQRLRYSRDFVGCSCRPIKLDKLNVGKLKAELVARKHLLKEDVDIEKLKKNELVHVLKEVLKECPTCVSEECECLAQGISCASNACDCVLRPGESESCENPFGSRTYDVEKVRQYRLRVLETVKNVDSAGCE